MKSGLETGKRVFYSYQEDKTYKSPNEVSRLFESLKHDVDNMYHIQHTNYRFPYLDAPLKTGMIQLHILISFDIYWKMEEKCPL